MNLDMIMEKAKGLRAIHKDVNAACAFLSGTAVTIPRRVPFPLHYFTGTKVIIHNARYNVDKDAVVASIKLPYTDRGTLTNTFGGKVVEVTLDLDWYPEQNTNMEAKV